MNSVASVKIHPQIENNESKKATSETDKHNESKLKETATTLDDEGKMMHDSVSSVDIAKTNENNKKKKESTGEFLCDIWGGTE